MRPVICKLSLKNAVIFISNSVVLKVILILSQFCLYRSFTYYSIMETVILLVFTFIFVDFIFNPYITDDSLKSKDSNML